MATFNSYIFGSFRDRRLFEKDSGGDEPGGGDDNVVVQEDDTLSQIAADNDTSVAQLMAINNITDPNKIAAGAIISTAGSTQADTYEGGVGSTPVVSNNNNDDNNNISSNPYVKKLEAAGESDMNGLDALAASNQNASGTTSNGTPYWTGNQKSLDDVFNYYDSGAGSPGATSSVDFSVTNSGNNFTAAAQADNSSGADGNGFVGSAAPQSVFYDAFGSAHSSADGAAKSDGTASNKYKNNGMSGLDALTEEYLGKGGAVGGLIAGRQAGTTSLNGLFDSYSRDTKAGEFGTSDTTKNVDYSYTSTGRDYDEVASADQQTTTSESGLSKGADLMGVDNTFTGYDNGVYYVDGVPMSGYRDGIYYNDGDAYDNADSYNASKTLTAAETDKTTSGLVGDVNDGTDSSTVTGSENATGKVDTGVSTGTSDAPWYTSSTDNDTNATALDRDGDGVIDTVEDAVKEIITSTIDETDVDDDTTTPYIGEDGRIFNPDGTPYEGEYSHKGTVYIIEDGNIVGTVQDDETTDGEDEKTTEEEIEFQDTNKDGKITSLEQEIANLRSELARITGQPKEQTAGMTREEIMQAINDAMKDFNNSNYDPMAFMNAFGFANQPTYFGETIPSFLSDDGVYRRRAVKDRDTGETRYVNVPIAAQGGGNKFTRSRRQGFGSLV